MTRYCYIDTETKSPIDIKRAGTIRYTEDCRVLCVTWIPPGSDECRLWEPHKWESCPEELWNLLQDPPDDVIFVAHNAMFDRHVVGWVLQHRKLRDPAKWVCTAALSRMLGFMGGLEAAGARLGLPEHLRKFDNSGGIERFCMMHHRLWCTPEEDPERWELFMQYAVQDTIACKAIHQEASKRMGKRGRQHWREFERRVFVLDQVINDRGFAVDPEVLDSALQMIAKLHPQMEAELTRLTNGRVTKVQSPKLLDYLRETYDCWLPNLRKETVAEALDLCEDFPHRETHNGEQVEYGSSELHPVAEQLLRIRQVGARNSLAKYGALDTMMSEDQRVRAGFLYGGAHTLRWSGQSAQPHNMARPLEDDHDPVDIAEAVRACRGDPETLGLFYDDPPYNLLVSGLRGAVKAPSGRRLVIGDYSQIESVLTSWFTGQFEKLDAYTAFYEGETDIDPYQQTAIDVLNVTPDQVRANKSLRQDGKMMDLGLGFGMGHRKFASVNRRTIEWAKPLVQAWRETYPNIRMGWKALESWLAWIASSENDGTLLGLLPTAERTLHWLIERGHKAEIVEGFTRRVRGLQTVLPRLLDVGVGVTREVGSVALWLPSGRAIYYPEGRRARRREMGRHKDEEHQDLVDEDEQDRPNRWAFAFRNQYNSSRPAHGGLLFENMVQGTGRELLAWHMVELDRRGWELVLHSHDEPVIECDEDQVERAKAEMHEVLTTVPAWLPGMPLYAEVFDTPRYTKR